MNKLQKLLLVFLAALCLTACESSVKLDETANAPETDSRTVATVDTGSTDPLNDPKGELARRSVYFDLDSYVVKDEYKPIVQAHARYLNKNRNRRILIQGNTDERGGSEYNLALGQKRAEAVRKAMSLMGVSDSQMEAVSFGKEKPRALGHDEASWAENRRADIVYQ
ncbi:MAG: peptidoglycan-associated lipoprotein Pal [Burkholderiaceae bacterium]|jgi:peptidoglycan-associated lipoprotein|nr:peptidoglycan-associated lipoprotein Pal [Burkholderiaceae bacterium]